MKRHLQQMFVFALLSIFSIVSGFAQVTTASMSGKVVAEHEPVIGASIVAIHEPSGTRYGAVTNVSGQFSLQGLRTGGPYKVEVSYIGYQTSIYKDIHLTLGETYSLNVTLKEDSQQLGEVVVTAQKTVEKMNTTTNVSERQITTLPTISRSITDFTKLSPFAGGKSSFAGRDGRYNYITIDGAALNNSFGLSSNNLPGGDAQPISLDAIEEISVNVSPYNVMTSNFTGASINAITKSGTNIFKGSAYTYLKPRHFLGKKVDGIEVANADIYRSGSYGFTLGGPIIKNKLFFFVNGELQRTYSPGILWTPNYDNSGKSNSQLHISRTSVEDLDIMKKYLMDTYNYDPGTYNNFDDFASKNYKIMARVDWNINPKHKLSLRMNTVDSKDDRSISATSAVINRTSDPRYGVQSFAFSNSNYRMTNVVTTVSGELNSTFSSIIQNKFLGTYTHIKDVRESLGASFPMVDIWKDDKQYMTFGTELFTPFNKVENNVFSLVDNVTFNLGNHLVTGGASFEHQYFMNSYLRAPYGYYRYNSMEDFMNNKTPLLYGITYGYNGKKAPGAELTFGMLGVYGQDVWSITPNFKLTYGLRLDMPLFFNKLDGNAAIAKATFRDGAKVDVSKWPKTQVMVSPRVGFNWDVYGDSKLVISGGSGLFTGLLPFVWFTNQPTDAGLLQNKIEFSRKDLPAGFVFEKDYNKTLAEYPDLFPTTPASKLPGSISFVDPNFKMPQVWRSNISADIKLPAGFKLSVGAMYTRDVYNIIQKNINEKAPNGTVPGQPGRVRWINKYKDYNVNSDTKTVIKLTNGSKKGYQYSFNAVLSKNFEHGFAGSIGYTYTMAKDLTSNPGSAASSTWQNNVAVNSLNDEELSYSLYSTPHRIIANASYEIAYAKCMKTTFSIFYSAFQQGRHSYVYNNDINGDFNRSDLIYVPKTADELTFEDIIDKKTKAVTYSAADQREDFWNFVNNDSYLKDRKGKYAERGGGIAPWIHRFDVKIAQDFKVKMGGRNYGLQVSLDMLNVGNLLKDTWGVYKSNGLQSYDNIKLMDANVSRDGKSVSYKLNARDRKDFLNKSEWKENPTVGNTWKMQLGFKLTF